MSASGLMMMAMGSGNGAEKEEMTRQQPLKLKEGEYGRDG